MRPTVNQCHDGKDQQDRAASRGEPQSRCSVDGDCHLCNVDEASLVQLSYVGVQESIYFICDKVLRVLR